MAFQSGITVFTLGAVSISHPTNIANCCPTNLFVSSAKILAHSVLNVNSTCASQI